jgi:hypothetical protein
VIQTVLGGGYRLGGLRWDGQVLPRPALSGFSTPSPWLRDSCSTCLVSAYCVAVAESQLHLPQEDWPLILCGPIVRRVTRTSATVFIATRDSFEGILTVSDGTDDNRQTIAQGGGTQQSLELEPGRIYGYDVSLGFVVSGSPSLVSLPVPWVRAR